MPRPRPSFWQRAWFWPLILAAVIALSLVGLWWSNQLLKTGAATLPPEPTPTPSPAPVEKEGTYFEAESDSDEIPAIEADLDETDLADLDQELEAIDAELTTP